MNESRPRHPRARVIWAADGMRDYLEHDLDDDLVPEFRGGGGQRVASRAKLVREGEYWTIGFAETELRVRDSKGMGYLAELLAHPGREIEAVRLARGFSTESVSSREAADAGLVPSADSDLGAVLDPAAKRAYRQRLEELREEMDRADAFNDLERAAGARIEWEAIVDELSAATGLGGRDRRAGSPAERARLNVTRAIKTAIARIAAHDPALGEHLTACVHTGRVCVYRPERSAPVAWNVSTRSTPRKRLPVVQANAIDGRRSPRVTVAYHAPGDWPIATAAASRAGFSA